MDENEAPNAVRVLENDTDVKQAAGLRRTLELMSKGVPVITHAALWWEPGRIYGACDLLVQTSWLYSKFPSLRPKDSEPEHYVVIDLKFSNLKGKKPDIEIYSNQVRMYSHIVSELQSYASPRAFLIDRTLEPIVVETHHELGDPLLETIARMRDAYVNIKQNGKLWLPWENEKTKVNFAATRTSRGAALRRKSATNLCSSVSPLNGCLESGWRKPPTWKNSATGALTNFEG